MKSKCLFLHSVLLGMMLSSGALIAASTIQFQTANFEVNEADGNEAVGGIARITVICSPPPTSPITARLMRTGGTAERNDFYHYPWWSGPWWESGLIVHFYGPGQSQATVDLPLLDDGVPEPDETVHFTIAEITGDAIAGALTNAALTIHNGPLRIVSDWLPAAHEGEPLRCNLYRLGDTNLPMSVDYATADDTARAGIDYVAGTGTVTFAAGQLSNQIQIATIDNGRVDGNREFQILLSDASAGVSLPFGQIIVARIADNEVPVIWDRSFDPGPSPRVFLQAFTMATDGKLIVAHWAEDEGPQIIRLNSDGSRDTSFTPAQLSPSGAARLLLDSEGRCLVLGSFEVVNNQPRPGIARLLSNGALDDSFQPPPSLAIPPCCSSPRIAIQPDGRLLFLNYDNEQKFLRLNPDGSVDNSFHPAEAVTNAQHVLITANTQVVTSVGFADSWINQPLVRLEPNGDLDATFHRAEFVTHRDQALEINCLAQQPDGKLLVAGQFQSVDGWLRSSLVRLHADGTVDTGFAPTLGAELDDGPGRVFSVVADSQNRVLLTGELNRIYGQGGWSLARLNPDGSLDSTFGPFGSDAIEPLAPGTLSSNDVFLGGWFSRIEMQPDGSLLVFGAIAYRWPCYGFGCPDIGLGPRSFLARMFGEVHTNSFEFANSRLVATEGESTTTVTVRRLGDTSGHATVDFGTSDLSAIAGVDYQPTNGTLTFAPLELVKSFTVPILNNGLRQQDRDLWLTLTNATGVQIISGSKARLTLVEPFGFRGISYDGAPTLSVFGSLGSSYVLESRVYLEPWLTWLGAPEMAWVDGTRFTLTNAEQTITDTISDQSGPRFYRLRRIAP